MREFKEDKYVDFLVQNGVIGFFDKPIQLKSGRLSNWYADFRAVLNRRNTKDELIRFVEAFCDEQDLDPAYYLGVPESMTCFGESLNEIYQFDRLVKLRAVSKSHGKVSDIRKAYFLGAAEEGDEVILLEDVTTTGGTLMGRINQCQEAGLVVVASIGLLNRMEKTMDGLYSVTEAIQEKYGVPHLSITTAEAVLPKAIEYHEPSDSIITSIEDHFKEYGIKPIDLRGGKK